MKFKSKKPKTEKKIGVKHKFRSGDVLHLGTDQVRINQVDLDTGMVYYSISYQRPNKRPQFGWVMGPFLDNAVITEVTHKPHKKAKFHGDDSEEVVKARVC